MENDITRVQKEIGLLAAEAERILERVRRLGEGLDAPLTEAQAMSLESEPLRGHVAERLLTTDDTPFEEVPAVLRRLAELRQELLDEAWRQGFPAVLAAEVGRHSRLLTDAAEDAVHRLSADPAYGGEPPDGRTALTAFHERLARHSAAMNGLEQRCRRYLADRVREPSHESPAERSTHDG